MTMRATLAKRRSDDNRSVARRTLWLTATGIRANRKAAEVLVHDLSPEGMLVESTEPLEIGELIAFELPSSGLHEANVVWSSTKFYGCCFKELLSAAAVSAALLKALPSDRTIFNEKKAKKGLSGLSGKLTAMREKRGLSVEELARILRVSRQALWYWETGQRFPRKHLLMRIAQEFAVPPSELSVEEERARDVYSCLQKCKEQISSDCGIPLDNIKIKIDV